MNAGYNLTATKYNKPKADGKASAGKPDENNNNNNKKQITSGDRTQEQLDKFFPKTNGALAGAYAGYNFDIGKDIIAGVETDFAGAFGKGKVTGDATATPAIVATELKQKWSGATRVRVGYAVENILPYVAAGVSYAGIQTKIGDETTDKFKDQNLVGFTVGAGVEYAVTQNIALRGEYRFNSYGIFKEKNAKLNSETETQFKFSNNDIRAGIAYKF